MARPVRRARSFCSAEPQVLNRYSTRLQNGPGQQRSAGRTLIIGGVSAGGTTTIALLKLKVVFVIPSSLLGAVQHVCPVLDASTLYQRSTTRTGNVVANVYGITLVTFSDRLMPLKEVELIE